MKNLWIRAFQIFLSDLKKICTNWVSLVILTGLVLLPSLYAWINIYASWDPYGSTKGVKVAIVNLDEGCDFQNTKIHIGTNVSNSLKENNKLGWTFINNEDKGLDLVQKGDVYATIIIPKDFSRKMVTLLDANPMKPELEYYVNEKINAIAPKMTDSGASTIQREITTSFVQTVADKAIELLGDAGIELDEDYPNITHMEDMILTLDKHFPEIESGIDHLADQAKNGKIILDKHDDEYLTLQKTLTEIIRFNTNITTFLGELSQFTSDAVPELKENLALAQNMFMDISEETNNLEHTLIVDKPIFLRDIDDTITKLQILKSRIVPLQDTIEAFDQSVSNDVNQQVNLLNQTIDTMINLLEQLKAHIDDPSQALSLLAQIIETSNKLSTQLESLKEVVTQIGKTTDALLVQLEKILVGLTTLSGDFSNQAMPQQLISQIKTYQQDSPSGPDQFSSVLPLLNEIISILQKPIDPTNPPSLIPQSGQLTNLIESLRTLISTNVKDTLNLITNMQDLLIEINNTAHSMSELITVASKDGVATINKMVSTLATLSATLSHDLTALKENTHSTSVLLENDLDVLHDDLTTLQKRLRDLSTAVSSDTNTEDLLHTISLLTYNIQTQLGNLNKALDDDFVSNIQRNIFNATGLVDDINKLLGALQKDLTELNEFATLLSKQDTILLSDVTKLQQKLPGIKKLVHTTAQKLNDFNGKINLKYLIDNMTMDNSAKSDFLASPVLLNSHKLYPMANYGAGMTPFYTTLCLWVGALLLTALLSTKAKNATFAYTPIQEFFGKYLLFLMLSMLQGLIAALGDLFVLGVSVQEPVLFVTLAVFYSMIFSGIIYTLVSLFGNVGKALGVILLVLQLAGSGGTFPIQVIPELLQKLSKFLPFTYAIGGMREAVAGVMFDNLILDIGMLLLFFILFMILGILLKQKANNFLHKFAHKLGESGVIEH
ncbi:MAG: YhgE/Pip family protein [Cellulosilyticaceae bacterium]